MAPTDKNKFVYDEEDVASFEWDEDDNEPIHPDDEPLDADRDTFDDEGNSDEDE